jgi:c-di-GMP-binding flagellar brake protein YcgR
MVAMEEEKSEAVPSGAERRQYRRVNCVCYVRCEGLGRADLLVTRDVSAGGMMVSARDPLPAGSQVQLSFHLNEEDPSLTCTARVVWAKERDGMRMEFLGLDQASKMIIQKFVDAAG